MSKKYQVPGTSDRKPLILLFVGVNGVGKTTSIGKIGKILKTTPEKILKTDRFDKMKNWDSLAQLDILSAIDKKLGNKLEFRTTIELSYQLKNLDRIGISLGHISNANIGDTNPGSDSVLVTFMVKEKF